MKVVDIQHRGQVAPLYKEFKPPLIIFHSTDEFESTKIYTKAIKIRNFVELLQFIQDKFSANQHFTIVQDYEVWLATNETEVRIYLDITGRLYPFYINDEIVKTDTGWIKLFAYQMRKDGSVIVFTSSGIWTVSAIQWSVSMAEKQNYKTPYWKVKYRGGLPYINRLEMYMNKRKPTRFHYNVAMAFMNPLSPAFGDIKMAFKMMGKRTNNYLNVREEDYERFLKSKPMKEALMDILKTIIPELKKEIQQGIPATDIVEYIKKLKDIAVEKKDINGMIKVLDKVVELGYEENAVISSGSERPMLKSVEALPDPFEEEEPKQIPSPEKDLDDETADTIREDLNFPDSYEMKDYEQLITSEKD